MAALERFSQTVRVPMHPDEIQLTAQTAKTLVEDQFPQWRDLAIRRVTSHGTVNHLF